MIFPLLRVLGLCSCVLKIVFELEESGTKRELCYKTEYGKRFSRQEALRLANEQE
ncbi:MAG: hypothetical protein J6Z08_06430 [Elusimicrobiales bacterium]|nr:hypothetical protein [Elusimicrobiales bacterium]